MSLSKRRCISSIHITNFLDALLTLCAVSVGVEEANPFLSWSFQYSSTTFLVVKFVVVAFAVTYLDVELRPPRYWVFSAILAVLCITLCWHAYGFLVLTGCLTSLGT